MMRSERSSPGIQVYIFQEDAKRMRANRSTTWSLFGLWTHSSSPVIQYVCKAGNGGQNAKEMGLELLGQCVDSSQRGRGYNYRTDSRSSRTRQVRKLTIYNDGGRLEPELTEEGSGLAPVRNCVIKELPMESPFKLFLNSSGETPSVTRNRSEGVHDTYSRHPQERAETDECRTNEDQWYATSSGSEKLRDIQGHCRDSLSSSDKVDINRDPSTHDVQLCIEHYGKTFFVDFPNDFPKNKAKVSYIDVYNSSVAVDRNDAVACAKDIVSVIGKYCSCYRCRQP